MSPVREVYTFTNPVSGGTTSISLAPSSSSISTTLTNTASIENEVLTLYDTKKNPVGKFIANRSENNFKNNTDGSVNNQVYLLNNGSYVMTLEWINNTRIPNTKYVSKSISTGGKYAGKDVTVTLKYTVDRVAKVVFEYEN
jgi:hypothetical protein